jgi:uncharacterized repeat protein (TIGR01451 family)
VYVVSNTGTAAGLGVIPGPLPTTQPASTPTLTDTRLATFSNAAANSFNGIAFDSTGDLFIQWSTSGGDTVIEKINPSTGAVIAGPSTVSYTPTGGGTGVDLGACSAPPTLELDKNVINRQADTDQFNLSITGGGITEGNTATTSGTANGVQPVSAGPLLGRVGTTYTFTETAAGTTTLANYTSTWQCVDRGAGNAVIRSGTGQTFTLAPSAGQAIVCTFTNSAPRLTLLKSSTATRVVPGTPVPYTLTVANTGAVAATSVVVTDTLPLGLSFASSTPPCAAAGQVVTCSLGTVAANSTTTIQLVTSAANPFPTDAIDPSGNVVNTATITAPGTNCPAGSTDPACTAALSLPVQTTLVIEKSSGVTEVAAGAPVPYTLTVTNSGPAPATAVVVTDVLPVGLSFVSSTPACTAVGQTVTCALGVIAAGASVTIDLATRAADPFPSTDVAPDGTVVNQATVTSPATNCPAGSTDPGCSAAVPLPVLTRLTLIKVVINDSGGTAVATDWTLTAEGPATISGTTGDPAITNAPVPPGTYDLSESGPAEYVPTDLTCDGGVQVGASITLALGERATCTVTNDDIGAQITMVKTSGVNVIAPGAQVPYTLTVTNVSQATARSVVVKDQLPEGLTFVSSPDSCTANATQLVVCNAGDLGPGAQVALGIVTLAANPFPGAAVDANGQVPNTATLTSPDTNCPPLGRAIPSTSSGIVAMQATAEDCSSTDLLSLLPTIAIKKTSTATEITPGATVPYEITVTNTGPVAARDVVVTDTLPLGLSFVSSTPSCTASGRAVTCQVGDVAAHEANMIHMVTLAADPFPTTGLVNGNAVNTAVAESAGSNCPAGSTDPACTSDFALPPAGAVGGQEGPGGTTNSTTATGGSGGGSGSGAGSGSASGGGGSLPFTGTEIMWTLWIAAGALALGSFLRSYRTGRRARRT